MAECFYEEIEIQIPNLCLAAKVWGHPSELPTLALHGWLDNAATFDHLIPFLPNLRIVALDLPGHGFSGHRSAGAFYHYIDMVPDVIAAADALGWESFALLGHSMGAGISTLLAGTQPDRVSHLMLIEGLGPIVDKPEDSPRTLSQSIRQMRSFGQSKLPVYPNIQAAVAARRTAGDLYDTSAETLVARGTKVVKDGIAWRSDPRLKVTSRLRLSEDQVIGFIDCIEAPTVLIRGQSGMLVGERSVDNRCEHVNDFHLEVIPGGHHLHLDAPELVGEAISKFLKKQGINKID
ncbi:MAG: alpha/beta hydrolase [SAR324 cluster bacterium]|nr:alpha/beta hydrolase [SAR324 cluster bacterium]